MGSENSLKSIQLTREELQKRMESLQMELDSLAEQEATIVREEQNEKVKEVLHSRDFINALLESDFFLDFVKENIPNASKFEDAVLVDAVKEAFGGGI